MCSDRGRIGVGFADGSAEEGTTMARMIHDISHNLSPDSARNLVKKAWKHYETVYPKYHPECHWKGDNAVEIRFRAGFVKLVGDLEITDSVFRLGLEVPATLRFLKTRALKVIDAEVRKWLAKAEELEHSAND